MKNVQLVLMATLLIGIPVTVGAEVIETREQTVTPTGVIIETTNVKGVGSDSLALGDPYGNGPLSEQALQGPKATQQSYGPGCTDALCEKARARQFSSPNWSPEKK